MTNDEDPIPEFVTEALRKVRGLGTVNMYARRQVMDEMIEGDEDLDDAADWLRENKSRYMEALITI